MRQQMKDASDQWRSHGFDLDFSELVFLGDRADLTEYLGEGGWRVEALPTNDLLIKYGLAPLDDGEGFADVVYVTARILKAAIERPMVQCVLLVLAHTMLEALILVSLFGGDPAAVPAAS